MPHKHMRLGRDCGQAALCPQGGFSMATEVSSIPRATRRMQDFLKSGNSQPLGFSVPGTLGGYEWTIILILLDFSIGG